MKAVDIMSKNYFYCTAESTIREVTTIMAEQNCGYLPVILSEEERRPIGVITDRNIVRRVVAKGTSMESHKVTDVMSNHPVTVLEDTPLEECCETMRNTRTSKLLVINEEGELSGVIHPEKLAYKMIPKKIAEVMGRAFEYESLMLFMSAS